MIASWMVYAALVGVLVTVAASLLERAAFARQRPIRFVWFAALLVSIVWPVGDAVRRAIPRDAQAVRLLPFTITVQSPSITAGPAHPNLAASIDRGLLFAWIGLSALLLVRLARGSISVQQTRGAWRRGEVDGTVVRLSDNVGPAVVGLRSMDVVLPEWILTLDESLRAIVLRHEQEHRAARDPYLLFGAAIVVALMPWNLALWFQARRLRLAIEMDCDARVLRAHPSTERYGLLMLTIAQRRSIAPTMFAPMLSEPRTQLERRILAMRTTTKRLARMTVYGSSVLAVGVLAFACSLQSDNPLAPRPSASRSAPTAGDSNRTYFEYQVEKAVTQAPGNLPPRYPDLLRSSKTEGEVLVEFVVDEKGHADMKTFKVLKSSHELFTAAVRGELYTFEFIPAQVGGHNVKQVVQMPFQFSLSREATPAAPASAPIVKREPNPATTAGAASTAVPAAGSKAGYFEFTLDKRAAPLTTNVPVRYPGALRAANIEGEVLVQFVVDANGVPDMATVKVLSSDHDLFTQALREALPTWRYTPAEVQGHAVKQLVTIPYQFKLSK